MNENESPMTECYVAFLDLMGVRQLTKKAAVCESIISALKETKNVSSFNHGTRNLETGEQKEWSLQVQAFSDSVVLFIPVETKMLSWLLASVRRLHDRLLRLNVPLRGGITVGAMHWDMAWNEENESKETYSAPVAFGPGLVAAYDLEDDTAVYPRILISSALYDHVDEQTKLKNKVFSMADSGNLLDFFRQDTDGLYHLDVLHADVNRKDVISQEKFTDGEGKPGIRNIFDETTYAEWLKIVRDFIVKGRDAVSGEKLVAKYMWLANYYNEKAKDQQGSKLIHWFENLVSEGAIKGTFKQQSPGNGN